MKVTKEQNAEHHRAILEAASRLFRERGFDAVSLIDVMKEAGLTHGAFYGHFASKSALAAEACRLIFEERSRMWANRDVSLSEHLDYYISALHRDMPGSGCPLTSFVSKIEGQDKIVQKQFAKSVSNYIDRVAEGLIANSGVKKAQARKQAAAIVSTMVGGVVLARSTSKSDRELSSELLTGSRATIKAQFRV